MELAQVRFHIALYPDADHWICWRARILVDERVVETSYFQKLDQGQAWGWKQTYAWEELLRALAHQYTTEEVIAGYKAMLADLETVGA